MNETKPVRWIRPTVIGLLVSGALGPTMWMFLSAHGVNDVALTGSVLLYAAALGLMARYLEKRLKWSGLTLCVAVVVLGAAMVLFIARRH